MVIEFGMYKRVADTKKSQGYQGIQALPSGKSQYTEIAGGIKFRIYLNQDGSIRNIHPEF